MKCGGRAVLPSSGPEEWTRTRFRLFADFAAFIVACAERQLPFKVTAGLHHPVRAAHPLTYEPDAPHGDAWVLECVSSGSLRPAREVRDRTNFGRDRPSRFLPQRACALAEGRGGYWTRPVGACKRVRHAAAVRLQLVA